MKATVEQYNKWAPGSAASLVIKGATFHRLEPEGLNDFMLNHGVSSVLLCNLLLKKSKCGSKNGVQTRATGRIQVLPLFGLNPGTIRWCMHWKLANVGNAGERRCLGFRGLDCCLMGSFSMRSVVTLFFQRLHDVVDPVSLIGQPSTFFGFLSGD